MCESFIENKKTRFVFHILFFFFVSIIVMHTICLHLEKAEFFKNISNGMEQ